MQGRNTRSVASVLIGLALGAMMISPAFANHTPAHTAKQIKKLTKKVNKLHAKVKTLPTASAVGQAIDAKIASVVKPFYGTLEANGEQTLITHGSLQLKMRCVVNDGGKDKVFLYFDSTAPDWWWSANESGDGPLPAGANNEMNGFDASNTTGIAQYTNDIDDGSAAVKVGSTIQYLAIDGEGLGLGLNVFGHRCLAMGHALVSSNAG